VLALIAGMAAAAGMFAFYRTDAVQAQNVQNTDETLAIAKTALIGYAVSRGGPTGNARPGELPCPDTDAPGTPGYGLENAPCRTAASLIGRIPWRTIGIPEPKDGAGETLWYALSTRFRDWDSFPTGTSSSARRINSDSRGNLTVRGPDGSSVMVSDAVAVIFAPGAPIGAQNRAGLNLGNLLCSLTGLLVPRQACATNYLDSALGINNAGSSAGPFISGPATGTFNDRLIYLTADEIIPAVEMRVGAELKALLEAYRANSICECYPWADNWPYSGGIADIGQNRGRFPSLPEPEGWGTNGIPSLPGWVAANDWHNFFWYSVGRQNTHRSSDPDRQCRTCSDYPMLKVTDTVTSGTRWVSALVLAPGRPLDDIPRLIPPTGQSSRTDNINLYLEDAENRTGANESTCPDVGEIGDADPPSGNFKGATICDEYVVPRSRAMNRDRLFTVGNSSPTTCATQAQTLLDNVTCSIGGGAVKAACQAAVANLDACPCLEGAREMIGTPCRNTTSPPQCQAAMAKLQTCN
jgi:hypothetical protein